MRMFGLSSRPSRLVPALFTVLQLLVVLVAGASPGKGYHSSKFDPKYNALRDLLITPATHPHLFRFTGRWTTSRSVYRATSWPGTSVTILIFGPYCSIKLRPQPGLGRVENYSYYISIDGGEDFRYDLPAFDTGAEGSGKETTLFVPVKFDIDGEGYNNSPTGQPKVARRGVEGDGKVTGKEIKQPRKLTPHTIRITSDPHTPFRFEGVLTENVLISQGWGWAKRQDERVTVEFIGEGIDAERLGGMGLTGGWEEVPLEESSSTAGKSGNNAKRVIEAPSLPSTVQYQAAERLAVRHWHTSAGVCLAANCNPSNPLPGLQTQYFQLNPLNHTLPFTLKTDLPNTHPNHPENKLDTYLFNPKQPTIPIATPSHLVVDLGIADVLLHNIHPDVYKKQLILFLSKLRLHAYPAADILVIARQNAPGKSTAGTHANDNGDAAITHPDSPADNSKNSQNHHNTPFHSTLSSTPEIAALRRKLFEVTASAVATVSSLYPPIPKIGSTGTVTFVPVTDTGANPVNDLVRALCVELGPAAKEGSKTAEVCGEIVTTVQKRGWVWDLLFLILGVGMAVVARETFMGAVRAVLGGVRGIVGGGPVKGKGKGRADAITEEEEEDLMGVELGKRRADEEKGKLG